ncbi:MAG: O-antigen ligase family protein [Candidatus Acidiferrales bacterium]
MRIIRGCVSALIAAEVLAFGGVEPWANFLLETGAAALTLSWALLCARKGRLDVHGNWLYVPMLGLCGLGAAQRALGWTVYAYATKVDLLILLAYVLVAFLAAESIRTESGRRNITWFLAVLSSSVSLFGIVQYLSWNGKIFWMRAIPQASSSFGPYVDRDHFAGFVELTAPFGLALLFSRAVRGEKLALACLLAILPVGALVLSGSRAGIVSFFLEVVVLGVALFRRAELRSGLLRLAAFFAIAGTLILWLGAETALTRFEQLATSGVSHDRRISMSRDTFRIFRDHPWTGTGLGTLQSVFPRYESYYDGSIVNHAHNDFIELLSDTGVAGGLCGLAFIVVLFRRGFKQVRRAKSRSDLAFYSGALAASTGILLHSLADFNLHIPANALLFVVISCVTTAPAKEPAQRGTLPEFLLGQGAGLP